MSQYQAKPDALILLEHLKSEHKLGYCSIDVMASMIYEIIKENDSVAPEPINDDIRDIILDAIKSWEQQSNSKANKHKYLIHNLVARETLQYGSVGGAYYVRTMDSIYKIADPAAHRLFLFTTRARKTNGCHGLHGQSSRRTIKSQSKSVGISH